MTDEDDLDLPPASEDDVVQQYLDTNFREALRASRDGMTVLRRVYPELTQHLPETGANYLRRALDDFEAAGRHLHLAGRHVLGQAVYDELIEALTIRQIET